MYTLSIRGALTQIKILGAIRTQADISSHLINRHFVLIRITDRLYKARLVVGQIFKLHHSSFTLHEINDGLGDPSAVKAGITISHKSAECVCEVWEMHDLARKRCAPMQKHSVSVGRCVAYEIFRALPLEKMSDFQPTKTDNN